MAADTATGVTEARVREVLNTVTDPCSIAVGVPAGMDDMGLITGIQIRDDGAGGQRISVSFGLTDPTCMLQGSFLTSAHERLAELPGVTGVDVELDPELEWTEDRFTPDYRRRLEAHRAERRRSLPLVSVAVPRNPGSGHDQ